MKRRKRKARNSGQGLTEYIIILALVAVAAIGIVNVFGNQLRHQFSVITSALAGHKKSVTDLSQKAEKMTKQKTLRDYATDK
ncbi:MAG: hypothetical protein D6713_10405 [Deltaproteobacteria bacterium]|nr:MAG: hypothetical protein D6713_10405 [Deltaproteobacteria bacterium]